MLKIKYNPGGVSLNGPAFEAYASKVNFGPYEILVVGPTPEAAQGIALAISDNATAPAHVLLCQPPWYQNETKDNTLEDLLPTVVPADASRVLARPPAKQAPPQPKGPRRRGLF